jgi:hypothetical protein
VGCVSAHPHTDGIGVATASPVAIAAASPVQLQPPELPPMHPEAPPLVALFPAHASADTSPQPSRAGARPPRSASRLYSQLAGQLHTDSVDSDGVPACGGFGSGGSSREEVGRKRRPTTSPMQPPPRSVRLSVSLSRWCAARARHPPGRLARLSAQLACRRAVRAWRAHRGAVRRAEADRLGEVCSWRVAALMGSHRREPVACGRASVVRWAQPLQLRSLRAWRAAARGAAAAADRGWQRGSAARAFAAFRAAVNRALFQGEAARLAATRRGWLRWWAGSQWAAATAAIALRAPFAAAVATSRMRAAAQCWRARTLPAAAARHAAAVAQQRAAGRAVVAWREAARQSGCVAFAAASAHRGRLLPSLTARIQLRRWAQVAASRRAASAAGCSRWLRRRVLLWLHAEATIRAAAAAARAAAGRRHTARALKVWGVVGAQGAAMRACAAVARAAAARDAFHHWGDRVAVSAAAAAIRDAAAGAGRNLRSRAALRRLHRCAKQTRGRVAAEATARRVAVRASAAAAIAWWGKGAAAAARRREGALLRQRRAAVWSRWVRAAARCKVWLARRERANRSLRRALLAQWRASAAAHATAVLTVRRVEAHALSARRRRGVRALHANASLMLERASVSRAVGGRGRARALGGALSSWAERGLVWAAEQEAAALHRRRREVSVFRQWVAEHNIALRLSEAVAVGEAQRARASRSVALRAWAIWSRARAAQEAARRAKAERCAAGGVVYLLAPAGGQPRVGTAWPEDVGAPGEAVGRQRRLVDCLQSWAAAAPRLGRERAARDRLVARLAAGRSQALREGWDTLAVFSAMAHQLRSARHQLRSRDLHRALHSCIGHAKAQRDESRRQVAADTLIGRSMWRSLRLAVASAAARGRWAHLLAARARARSVAAAAAVARWVEARRRRSAWLRHTKAADAARTTLALKRMLCGAVARARAQCDAATADAAWRRTLAAHCTRRWRLAACEIAQLSATQDRAWVRLRRRSAFEQWQLWFWGRLCALAAATHHARTVSSRVMAAWAGVVRESASRRIAAIAAADRRTLHTCLKQWGDGVAAAKAASAQALKAAEAERWLASLAGRSSYLTAPSSHPPLWTHRFLRDGTHDSPAHAMPLGVWGHDAVVYGAAPDLGMSAGASTRAAAAPREQLAPAGTCGWGHRGGIYSEASSTEASSRLGGTQLPVVTPQLQLGGPPLSALVDEYEIERAAQHAATVERARRESNRARLEMLRAQSLAEAALGATTPTLQQRIASQPATPGWNPHQYAASAPPSVRLPPSYATPYAPAHPPMPPPYTPQPPHLSSPVVGGAAERLEGLLREFRSISSGAGPPPAASPHRSAPQPHPPSAVPSRPHTPAAARAPTGTACAPTGTTRSPARASPGPHTLRLAAAAAGHFAAAGALAGPGPRRVVRRLACASSGASESGESDSAQAEDPYQSGRASPPKRRAAEYIDRVRRGAAARRASTPV